MQYRISRESSMTLVSLTMTTPLDDAASVLGDLAKELAKDSGPIVFDVAGVSYFNSPAIRGWVLFVEALDRPYSFRRCSSYFIEYGNMAQQIFGAGTVESLHVPYRCAACNEDFEVLEMVDSLSGRDDLPVAPCPQCRASTPAVVTASDFLFFLGT